MFLLVRQVLTHTNYYVGTILPPSAMALGGLGHLFCLLVFSFSHLRRLNASPMLIGLSVCHMVALGGFFLVWLERLDIFILDQRVVCQILNFLHHSASFLGVAFVLLFTIERYTSFCWLKNTGTTVRTDARRRRFLLVTIALSVVVPLACTFIFVQLGRSEERNCHCCFVKFPLDIAEKNTRYIPMYILSVYYIIAFILMLATLGLDISIMVTLFRKERERMKSNVRNNGNGADSRSLRKDFDQVSTDNLSIGHCDDIMGGYSTWPKNKIDSMPRPLRKMRKRQMGELRRSRSLLSIRSTINATRMLFAASITFTVMQMPLVANQVYESFLFFMRPYEAIIANPVFYNVAAILYVVSISIAFIVYMSCGQNFREAVKMLITCQYGRACAHAPCVKRWRKTRSEVSETDRSRRPSIDQQSIGTPASEKKRPPSTEDDVSQYMDDTTEAAPNVEVHEAKRPAKVEPVPNPAPQITPKPAPAPTSNGTPQTYREYNPRMYRPQGYGYNYSRPNYGHI